MGGANLFDIIPKLLLLENDQIIYVSVTQMNDPASFPGPLLTNGCLKIHFHRIKGRGRAAGGKVRSRWNPSDLMKRHNPNLTKMLSIKKHANKCFDGEELLFVLLSNLLCMEQKLTQYIVLISSNFLLYYT